uniref:RING-type domain-containing protein n=1 Tax=Rhodosorus marinus TaxID=101924 RepID=A0A7S3E7T4_9RHOD|mmetsp:Transcript_12446/g.50860  ORF Transcript_12446/g.50860 Transcript_12446/m.50860 type:complete len:225 (+) Transcript_12446:93-767(+)
MVSRLGRLVGLAAKLRELSRFARAYKGVPGAGAGAGAGEGGVVRAVSSRAGVISSPERLRFERYWREWNFESGRNRLSELVRLVFRRLGGWEGFEKLKMKRVSRLETVGTSSLLNSVGNSSVREGIVLQTSNPVYVAASLTFAWLQDENRKLRDRLNTIQARVNHLEAVESCIVCMDNPRSVAYGCGHRIVCSSCDYQISQNAATDKCPCCRSAISTRIHYYTT